MNFGKPRSLCYSILVITLFVSIIPSLACGPWFPDSLLKIAYSAIRPPIHSLEIELERIELDVTLPGKLSLPSRVPMPPHFATAQLLAGTVRGNLFNLPPSDLIQNSNDCRKELLASTSPLARDVANLAQSLQNKSNGNTAFDKDAAAKLLQEYYKIRKNMFGFGGDAKTKKAITERNWPNGLPQEFSDYLSGAADFRDKKYGKSRKHFEAILALPLEDRRNRATIAAYMLGRVALKEGDPKMEHSIPHFRRVLELREEGCGDVFGVGWDALQCVADYEIKFGDKPELGKRYYFALARTGHKYSIKRLKSMIKESDFDVTAKDPFLRKITTAVLTGIASQRRYRASYASKLDPIQEEWLTALENAEVQDSEACRIAQMAYRSGDFDSAKRWLKRAATVDSTGNWVQAKLDLQAGKIPAAQIALDKAKPEFHVELDSMLPNPTDQEWPMISHETRREYRSSQYWGDQGLVKLANNDFIGALDAFVRSGYWYDAAYVAEQLLSRDELLTWVLENSDEEDSDRSRASLARLRYLTARRLARDHCFKNAEPLFPINMRPIFSEYVKGYRVLQNTKLNEETRITEGWKTAQIHRKLGMELFGTELEPDWFCYMRGSYRGYSYTESRLSQRIETKIDPNFNDHFRNPYWKKMIAKAAQPVDRKYWKPMTNDEQLPPTNDEKWRHRHYALLPNTYRFHYRHVAADIAWEVSRLMPGDSPETANILAISGRWLSVRTPEPANLFYRALVNRNRSTELGHEADMRRWFPYVAWDFDPWNAAGVPRPTGF